METLTMTRKRALDNRIIYAVKRAKTLMFDGEPAESAIIVNDKPLAEILGVSPQTVWNWKQQGILVSYKKQSPRVVIYKLRDVIKDLERWI